MSCRSLILSALMGLSMLGGLFAAPAFAQNGTWITLNGTTPWSTATNWSGNTIADGADNTANFTANINAALNVTLDDAGREIGNITFTDSTTSSNDMTISGTNVLTLNRTDATKPTINVTQSGRSLTIGSTIAGDDGVRKLGAGTLIFNATSNNTFTGGFDINGGVVQVDSSTNANAFGDVSNTITFTGTASIHNTNNLYTIAQSMAINPGVVASLTGANAENTVVNGPVSGSGELRIGSSSNTMSASLASTANTHTGTFWVGSQSGGLNVTVNSLADGPGALKMGTGAGAMSLTFGTSTNAPAVFISRQVELAGSTGTITLANNATSATNTITVVPDLAFTTAGSGAKTFTLSGSNAGVNTFSGNITDNGVSVTNITKAGGGRWLLPALNTYTGITTVSAGTLEVTKLDIGGNSSSIGASGAAAANLVFNNTGTLRYVGAGDTTDRQMTYNSGTNNSGWALDASGTGAIVFSSASGPTYTGTAGQNRIITLTGTSTGNNTLRADIANNGAGTVALTKTGVGTWVLTGNNTATGASASTVSGGGDLVLDFTNQDTSKLSDTGVLTLSNGAGGITLRGGSHVETVGSLTVGAGGGSTLVSRDGGNGTIAFGAITRTSSGGVTLTLAEDNLATTSSSVVNGILTGGIFVGSNWARVDAGNIVGLTSGNYTALTANATTSTVNYQLTGNLTRGAASLNALRIVSDGNDQVLDMGAGNLNPSPLTGTMGNGAAGGILYAGGGNDNYTITGTGNLQAQNNNQELIINTYQGTLNVEMRMTMGSAGLTKAGAGTLNASGNGTYTGTTNVNQGILRLSHANGAGTTGAINVHNGAALELDGVSVTNNKSTSITGSGVSNGGALANFAGTSSYNGVITVGTGGARINANAGSLTLTNGVVTAALNPVTFGGAGNTTVSTVAISGAGALVKDGAGVLDLTFANTYQGGTTVNDGTLLVNNSTGSGTGTGAVTVGADGILGGTGSIAGSLSFDGDSQLWVADLNDPFAVGGTVSFSSTGFGIASLVNIDWDAIGLEGTYTLVSGTVDFTNVSNVGESQAAPVGTLGRTAYFQNGSLQLVVVPEPAAVALAACGLVGLGIAARRRFRH